MGLLNAKQKSLIESEFQDNNRSSVKISNAIGQSLLMSFERGYDLAVAFVRMEGAHDLADDLEKYMEDYWRSQGVEPE